MENNHERNWIKDKNYSGSSDIPNWELDRYKLFLDYLHMISIETTEYWRMLEFSEFTPLK